jgi:zinc protease
VSDRFVRPSMGSVAVPRFPTIAKTTVGNGLDVWTIPHAGVPAVTVSLVLPFGSADDPDWRPGLVSLAGDLADEGAGDRDAIGVADALARLGTSLDIDVGADVTTCSFSAVSRVLGAGLSILADVIQRPHFGASDLERIRELRLSRLRQLSRSASTVADRAFVSAVFAAHPYGHGSMGTTASLSAIGADDIRELWAERCQPAGSTLIVAGDVSASVVERAVGEAFGGWRNTATARPTDRVLTEPAGDPRLLIVDRPGAPQCELRLGHVGPSRATERYHALLVLNAVLGGQFTSRINRRLREEKGVTYGAHTSFDFRKIAGSFSCATSVEADATSAAIEDVLDECSRVTREPVPDSERAAACAYLTRGYVRQFETAAQLARAAVQLAGFGLPDTTFERFVPGVEAVDASGVLDAARSTLRPDAASLVVVGDADRVRPSLEALGREITAVAPEF